jgi:hypothetical protein
VRREVSARLVSEEVSKEVSTAREREAFEVAAARGVEIVRQHRKDIGQQTALVRRLVSELEESTIQKEEIVETIEAERL